MSRLVVLTTAQLCCAPAIITGQFALSFCVITAWEPPVCCFRARMTRFGLLGRLAAPLLSSASTWRDCRGGWCVRASALCTGWRFWRSADLIRRSHRSLSRYSSWLFLVEARYTRALGAPAGAHHSPRSWSHCGTPVSFSAPVCSVREVEPRA